MERSVEVSRRLLETSAFLDELMAEVRALKVAVQLAEMLQIEDGANVEAAATLAPVKMSA